MKHKPPRRKCEFRISPSANEKSHPFGWLRWLITLFLIQINPSYICFLERGDIFLDFRFLEIFFQMMIPFLKRTDTLLKLRIALR
jgi:hypothetical protein